MSLTALRGLLPSAKSVSAVLVLTVSLPLTTATVRGTEAAAEEDRFDAPTAASYPVATRSLSFADRVSMPSELADPLPTSGLLDPLAVVGSGTDCTNVPVGEYSSRNTGAPLPDSAVEPSPNR